MKIVRVAAEGRDAMPDTKGFRVYVLCGLNADNTLADGEWMGYAKQKGNIYPFVLQGGRKLIYGMEEPYFELTDLGSKRIEPDSYFTVEGAPDIDDSWATVYKILSVHSYEA